MATHAPSTTAPAAEQDEALRLDLSRLLSLRGDQLLAVYDALSDARAAVLGVANQPRCRRRGSEITDGGDLLHEVAEWLDSALERVVAAAEGRPHEDKDDSEWCAWLGVKHQVSLTDDLDDLIAFTSGVAMQHRRRSFPAGGQS